MYQSPRHHPWFNLKKAQFSRTQLETSFWKMLSKGYLFLFLVFGVYWESSICGFVVCNQIWKNCICKFFKYIFLIPLNPYRDSNYMKLSHSSLVLFLFLFYCFYFLNFLFVFHLDLVSIAMSSSWLIFSCAIPLQLYFSSRIFFISNTFISNIVVFISRSFIYLFLCIPSMTT